LNILALVGSPRSGGNTDFLVDQALAEAAELGAETEKIILSQYDVKPCQQESNGSSCLIDMKTVDNSDLFCLSFYKSFKNLSSKSTRINLTSVDLGGNLVHQ